jgi:uncharacterized membrane protein YidH (DUF202 family)
VFASACIIAIVIAFGIFAEHVNDGFTARIGSAGTTITLTSAGTVLVAVATAASGRAIARRRRRKRETRNTSKAAEN